MNPAEASEAKIKLWYLKYRPKATTVLNNKPTIDPNTHG